MITIQAGGNQTDFTVTDNSGANTTATTQQITLSLTEDERRALAPLKAAVDAQQPAGVLAAMQRIILDHQPLLIKVAEIAAKFI